MKIIYSVYGEDKMEDYRGMWCSGLKDEGKNRLFHFDFLARQTLFSIKSLRLWDKDVIVEIYTNKPDYKGFQNLDNVNIIDMRDVYEEYKKKDFWPYIIKFESFTRVNDTFLFLDCDTWFKGFDKKDLRENDIYCDTEVNYGIFGLHIKHKDMCQKMADNAKHISLENLKNRNVSNLVIDPVLKNRNLDCVIINNEDVGLKKHPCNRFIFHYWKTSKYKTIVPPDSLLKKIKKFGAPRRWYDYELR